MRRFVLGSTSDASNLYASPETENKTTPGQSSLLIISDDPAMCLSLAPKLQRLGLDSQWVASYPEALDQTPADLHAILLDLLVPRSERYSICREVKATFGLPVIVVDERPDDALGTTLEADFYFDKPVTAESIWASLHAVTARQQLTPEGRPQDELVMFSKASVAFVGGRQLSLSADEFAVLSRLASSEGRVISRSELAKTLCFRAGSLDPAAVDIHVVRLMAKLATQSSRRIVRSAKDDGYVLLTSQT
jgi:DNA-binding response OmpR family regulator